MEFFLRNPRPKSAERPTRRRRHIAADTHARAHRRRHNDVRYRATHDTCFFETARKNHLQAHVTLPHDGGPPHLMNARYETQLHVLHLQINAQGIRKGQWLVSDATELLRGHCGIRALQQERPGCSRATADATARRCAQIFRIGHQTTHPDVLRPNSSPSVSPPSHSVGSADGGPQSLWQAKLGTPNSRGRRSCLERVTEASIQRQVACSRLSGPESSTTGELSPKALPRSLPRTSCIERVATEAVARKSLRELIQSQMAVNRKERREKAMEARRAAFTQRLAAGAMQRRSSRDACQTARISATSEWTTESTRTSRISTLAPLRQDLCARNELSNPRRGRSRMCLSAVECRSFCALLTDAQCSCVGRAELGVSLFFRSKSEFSMCKAGLADRMGVRRASLELRATRLRRIGTRGRVAWSERVA